MIEKCPECNRKFDNINHDKHNDHIVTNHYCKECALVYVESSQKPGEVWFKQPPLQVKK